MNKTDDRPKVFVTQIPVKKDILTSSFVPTVNITPATEFGEIVVMMPPRASFHATKELVDQLESKLRDYSYERGDALIALGDPVVAACSAAILGRKGRFTVLKWDRQLGRYTASRIVVNHL